MKLLSGLYMILRASTIVVIRHLANRTFYKVPVLTNTILSVNLLVTRETTSASLHSMWKEELVKNGKCN
jgi:hypothetical protein